MLKLINENQLDHWIASNEREAQALTATLVSKLVWESLRSKKDFRFPEGDSIGQTGADGRLETDDEFEPFVPKGKSVWEFGAGKDAQKKATSDYTKRTKNTDDSTRQETTFVFVTPRWGVSGWSETSQTKWINSRKKKKSWKDIKVLDGARLVKWIEHFPNIQSWLAGKMGIAYGGFESVEEHWSILSSYGEPPPLSPQVFTTNRQGACEKFQEILDSLSNQLQIDTHTSNQLANFAAAYIASLPKDARTTATGRAIIVTDKETWRLLAQLKQKHILIANFPVDLEEGGDGSHLIQTARKNNHAVVYAAAPGGVSEGYRISLPEPTATQLQEQLEKSGYQTERARRLAQKCDGRLHGLLRQIQQFSARPEWTQSTDAAELVIAELIGKWNEKSPADVEAIEVLSGKEYGEWIKAVRQAALRPDAPLSQRDGKWKFNLRYDGWFELGKHIFDDHLDKLKQIALAILTERDPILDVEKDERSVARIRGVSLSYSDRIRTGIAETLALLGSFPKALTSCTLGKAEYIAAATVRELLSNRDWSIWATLNDELPLLAEAAPNQFLEAVEFTLSTNPSLFLAVFKQEGGPIFGQTYTSGLLWALETLAWSPDYLTRVIVALGGLSSIDPGGTWANRPANSIRTILLPWFPQTSASVEGRVAAVKALVREYPKQGWESLLKLLPEGQSGTSHTRRPAWREFIPSTWTEKTSNREYFDQVTNYARLVVDLAIGDSARAALLIDHLDALPPEPREKFLNYLESTGFQAENEDIRSKVWDELSDLIVRHKKFADADWAMPSELLQRLEHILTLISPQSEERRYRRLFTENEFDLIEEKESYEKSLEKLEGIRRKAINEIISKSGVESVIAFAALVQSPWRVGFSLGALPIDADNGILPNFLTIAEKSLRQFSGGYVFGRFKAQGWAWVDKLDVSTWSVEQKGQFYSYLPFVVDTWRRVAIALSGDASAYWLRANANPYEEKAELSTGIDNLIKHKRPSAAIQCLSGLLYQSKAINPEQAFAALQELLDSDEEPNRRDSHAITQVIAALQKDPSFDQSKLIRVEWSYMSLLDGHHGPTPRTLEKKIAEDPQVFLDLIRLIYKPDSSESEEISEERKNKAVHAYRLLQKWKTIPGTQTDGSFSEESMHKWLDEVKKKSKESGHYDVALTHVGHVFAYCPPDPSGLWIREPVAAVLNDRDSESMRNGFSTENFNSRGVHWGSQGAEERRLAAVYLEKANAVDRLGYQRLAATVREIGNSYIRYAESEEREDRLES
jgi:hypothetical protein